MTSKICFYFISCRKTTPKDAKLQLPEVMVFMISMNITSLIIDVRRRGPILVTKHFSKATLVLG